MEFEPPTPQEVETQKPVIDMDSIKLRVPPIKGVFSTSKEVQKLWKVPREQREEAIASFKDKLARQREAWALCRTSIEELINSNPDLPREEMVEVIGKFASQYGFSPDHVKVAESLVDGYLEMRRRAVNIREKYPNDIDLINHLTGLKFTESDKKDFKVTLGPMSIEISCSGFNAGRIYERSENPVEGFTTAGFAVYSRIFFIPSYYLVVNNDYASSAPVFHAGVAPHEREHLKNFILSPKLYDTSKVRANLRQQLNRGVLGFLRHQILEKVLRFERNFVKEIYKQYELEKDPDKKAILLAEYMRLERETALNSVKDEIMATKSEPNSFTNLYRIFTSKNGDYDYLSYIRENYKKKKDPLWQKTAQRVLVKEYGEIIEEAVYAFYLLESKGYSPAEVIAMLTDKRLAEWPKTVTRLLEQRKKRLIPPTPKV